MFAKFIALLSMLALSITITVAVMIKGWGLEPVSWWWIVGVGYFGHLAVLLGLERMKKELEEK